VFCICLAFVWTQICLAFVIGVIPYMDFHHATIVDRVRDYHKRLLLEAWLYRGDSMWSIS